MPTLYVLSGPEVGKTFSVQSGDTLGRAPDRIVTLRHPSVSRAHAHFEEQGGAWALVDDGSRNGVLLGGQRAERVQLHDAIELTVGEIRLRFRLDEPSVAPAPTASPAPGPAPGPAAEEEIFLEGFDDGPELDSAPAERSSQPKAEPAAKASAAPRPKTATKDDPARQVLQYHRVASEGGTDLAQLPPLVRTLLIVLALALAAGLAWLAFQGTFFVRDQVS